MEGLPEPTREWEGTSPVNPSSRSWETVPETTDVPSTKP